MIHWIPFCVYLLISGGILASSFSRHPQFSQRLTLLATFCYFVIILRLCLTPVKFSFITANRNLRYFHGVPYNLLPFQQVDLEWWLNVVMTLPLGILLYLISRKSPFIKVLCISFLFSFFIEGNQFVCDFLFHIGRVADIDDIISNTLGGILGFYAMKLIDHGLINKIFHPFFLS